MKPCNLPAMVSISCNRTARFDRPDRPVKATRANTNRSRSYPVRARTRDPLSQRKEFMNMDVIEIIATVCIHLEDGFLVVLGNCEAFGIGAMGALVGAISSLGGNDASAITSEAHVGVREGAGRWRHGASRREAGGEGIFGTAWFRPAQLGRGYELYPIVTG